jgi:hypothetical protein
MLIVVDGHMKTVQKYKQRTKSDTYQIEIRIAIQKILHLATVLP